MKIMPGMFVKISFGSTYKIIKVISAVRQRPVQIFKYRDIINDYGEYCYSGSYHTHSLK